MSTETKIGSEFNVTANTDHFISQEITETSVTSVVVDG
jgi:hypothetical protein